MFDMDEDDEREQLLKQLGGEVDDFAADQIPPSVKGAQGVTIEISIKPQGHKEPDGDEDESKNPMEAENGEHDPIAHILGMCGGGCPG